MLASKMSRFSQLRKKVRAHLRVVPNPQVCSTLIQARTAVAGVTMTLKPNAYRELRESLAPQLPLPPSLGALTEFKPVEVDWHTAAEWGYLFKGSCRISTVDTKGKTFIDDIDPGDLWSALCLPATSPSLMVRIQVLPVRNSPKYSSFW